MNYYKSLFSLTLFSLSVLYTFSQQKEVKRERLPMDHDWRFAFGHPYDVLIIQTTQEPGDIVLTATSPNLKPASLRLVQEPVKK